MARGAGRVPHARRPTAGPGLTRPRRVQFTCRQPPSSAPCVGAGRLGADRVQRPVSCSTGPRQHPGQLRPLPALSPVTPLNLFSVNDHEGWLLSVTYLNVRQCAEEVVIWHTTDAGATWRQLTTTGLASMPVRGGDIVRRLSSWIFDRLGSQSPPDHLPNLRWRPLVGGKHSARFPWLGYAARPGSASHWLGSQSVRTYRASCRCRWSARVR